MNFKAFLPCYDGTSIIKVHNRGRKCEHNAYCNNRCASCEHDIEYVRGKWIYWDKFGRIFQKESDTNHYLISELMDELIPETIRQAVPGFTDTVGKQLFVGDIVQNIHTKEMGHIIYDSSFRYMISLERDDILIGSNDYYIWSFVTNREEVEPIYV